MPDSRIQDSNHRPSKSTGRYLHAAHAQSLHPRPIVNTWVRQTALRNNMQGVTLKTELVNRDLETKKPTSFRVYRKHLCASFAPPPPKNSH